MKKTVLAVAVLLSTSTFAQEKEYLPVAEDWAIGIDATPMLNYIGNFIGGNGLNTAPTWNFATWNQTISGKYFVEDNKAYRANIRLGFGSNKGAEMVTDRSFTGTVEYPSSQVPEVENTWKMASSNIGLGAGMEWRRGYGRLQGFYGGELGFAISTSKATYTYGNALNQSTTGGNVNVDMDDDMGGLNLSTDPFGNGSRILEQKNGMMFGVGVRGFIGAEYFLLPKLSVGGEFGWGLVFSSTGASSTTMESEGLNGSGTEVSSEFTVEGSKSGSFGLDTDNVNQVFGPAGSLRITFHF